MNAGKKIQGRKRHLLTDTRRDLPGMRVTPASVQDRDAAKVFFCVFSHVFLSLRLIFADGGHQGQLQSRGPRSGCSWAQRRAGAGGVKPSDKAAGFTLLPRR
jgi:Transposase DDE domain